jgi:hypothetical protein
MSRGYGQVERHILKQTRRVTPELIPVLALAVQFYDGTWPTPAQLSSFRRAARNLVAAGDVTGYEVCCTTDVSKSPVRPGIRQTRRWLFCVTEAGIEITDDMVAGAQRIMIDMLMEMSRG